MARVLLNLAVFTLGVVVAALFATRGRILSFASTVTHGTSVEIQKLAMPSNLDTEGSKRTYARERRAVLGRTVNDESRVVVLVRALDDGSIESLELLRRDYLTMIPHYEKQLLPKLKRGALEALFKRFTDRDWKEWPSLAHDPTVARTYVNDVTLVNPDVGNFIETAAHLLHGMYVSIASGEVYKVDEDLYYLTQNASEILKGRTLNLGAAEEIFDTKFVKDPTVALTFERVKTELTKQFVKSQPQEVAAQLRLLAALDPRAADRESAQALAAVLRALTLRASLQFRADVFPDIVGSASLAAWAKADPVVAQPLAELYQVGALDALEVGRTSLAKKLLDRSDETFPGLRMRESVVRYFDSLSAKSVAARAAAGKGGSGIDAAGTKGKPPSGGTEAAEEDSRRGKSARDGSKQSGGGLFGLIKWLLLLLFAGVGVRAFLVYLARQQDAAYNANLPATVDQTSSDLHPRMTDPGDVSFDVDEDGGEIDLGFDQEIANR